MFHPLGIYFAEAAFDGATGGDEGAGDDAPQTPFHLHTATRGRWSSDYDNR